MKKKNVIALLAAFLMSGFVFADHHEGHGHHHGKKKVNVHGTIDLNYTYNFNKTDRTTTANLGGTPTYVGGLQSFDTFLHDNNTAGILTVNFSGSTQTLDWFLELAVEGESKALATDRLMSQAYLTHHFSDDLSLTAGRMFSNVGFEGAWNKDNWNYSKSWAYGLTGPIAHDGIALKYAHNSGFGVGLFAYDSADSAGSLDGGEGKSLSAQLSYGHEMFGIVYNFLHDDDGFEKYHNLNLTADVNPALSLAASLVMSDDMRSGNNADYFGWALYAKYNLGKHNYIAPRFEQLNNDNGTTIKKLTSATLTYGYNCEKSGMWRLEGRYDKADGNGFVKKSDSTLSFKDSAFKTTLAWMYAF